tara:strand:- start:33152 stop:33358 length:207 start_codon:yes stop_codon:yes gene_type:complete
MNPRVEQIARLVAAIEREPLRVVADLPEKTIQNRLMRRLELQEALSILLHDYQASRYAHELLRSKGRR